MRTMMRSVLPCCLALALLVSACGEKTTTVAVAPPTPAPTGLPTVGVPGETKPQFNWGYPLYSQYDNSGKHIGKTLYQTDPLCIARLQFYDCAFVNAQTPDTPQTNPTMASSAMTGGMDSCTDAIGDEQPSYCLPADVCNPTMQNNAWAPGQASLDNLAWQLFIALNWPADANQPGYPDVSKKLGDADPAGSGHAKAVWLDYPSPEDLFAVPSPCGTSALSMTSKLSDAFLSKQPPLGALGPLGGSLEAGGGVLVDQNHHVVYEEIRENRTMWEFIVNQNDYWMTGSSLAALQQSLTRNYNDPPGQTPGGFPAAIVTDNSIPGDIGAMEVKAAWKQLTPDEVASGTYYTRTFTLYDASAPADQQCTPRSMGLIGMHIEYMPALFGNPEWIWATFEHKLNVPTAGVNDGATQFSLYNPNCTPVKTEQECATYDRTKDSPADFQCCPNLALYGSSSTLPPNPADIAPNQVTRDRNPSTSTILPTDCTGEYISAITKYFGASNVFQNYFLVSTQWPLRGASTNFPFYAPAFAANFPCTLRNTTLETFSVDSTPPATTGCTSATNTAHSYCRSCNGDCVDTAASAAEACPGGEDAANQFGTADCMGCHGMYAHQNSSFVFTHRPCCVRKDGTLPNTCGPILQTASCTAHPTCTWVESDPMCQGG